MLEPWNWVWHRLLIARTQSTVLTLFQRPKSSVRQHTSAIFIYYRRGLGYRSSCIFKGGFQNKVSSRGAKLLGSPSLCYLQARNLSFSITPFQAIAWNTNIKVVNVVVLDPKRKHLMRWQRCFSNSPFWWLKSGGKIAVIKYLQRQNPEKSKHTQEFSNHYSLL